MRILQWCCLVWISIHNAWFIPMSACMGVWKCQGQNAIVIIPKGKNWTKIRMNKDKIHIPFNLRPTLLWWIGQNMIYLALKLLKTSQKPFRNTSTLYVISRMISIYNCVLFKVIFSILAIERPNFVNFRVQSFPDKEGDDILVFFIILIWPSCAKAG